MTDTSTTAPLDVRRSFERDLERHRVEIRAYCYRMLGSAFDAEDAVQETLVRAWRHLDRFEGRSSMRSWIYRIATNVCLDVVSRRGRRAVPVELRGPGRPADGLGTADPAERWVEPMADALVVAADDPAEQAVVRDSVRLAFVAALQSLPPRQRAALLLREVLSWKPAEIAELLGTTTVSVNSALQRARQRLASMDVDRPVAPADSVWTEKLLRRYIEAFERHDIDTLVSLIHEDATWTMPPFALWFRGVSDIRDWLERKPCGEARFVPLALNGTIGCAAYHSTSPRHREAFGVQVLEVRGDRIGRVDTFLDARLVAHFDLPLVLRD